MSRKLLVWFSAFPLMLNLYGCGNEVVPSSQDPTHRQASSLGRKASADVIKAHMAFLADDLLEGRDAGSRGEAIAALYIASEFEGLGLEPMGGGQSFIQPVPLRSARLDLASVEFAIEDEERRVTFPNGDEIAVFGSLDKTNIDMNAEAVFAGHGITAPEFGLTDYEELDVTGKIAVVIGGPPAFLPSAEAAHFGATAQKRKMAADAGAIGLVRLWTPTNEGQVPFDLLKGFLSRSSMTWVGPEGQVTDLAPEIILRATVHGAAAERLFDAAPMSAAEIINKRDNGPVSGFPLGKFISLALTTEHNEGLASGNVAGFLPGVDPELKDEVVVVTAHYDHVGFCREVGAEDRICNGALDNALGTAAMMDVARQFAASGTLPKRSILFLAVGAEEKGLLGSDYFANFPTLGERKIVANINMDGGIPLYEFSDVIAFGAEQSELGETLASAIEPMGLTLTPDPFPELSIFTRSDQYSFIQKGVPSLFLYHGFNDMNGDNVGRAVWDEMLATRYHQPSDDLSIPIRYDVMAKYSEVFYRLTLAVADAPTAPQWYEDSILGKIYAPTMQKAKRPTSNSK